MHPFSYRQTVDEGSAIAAVVAEESATYIAGGTGLIDLMKLVNVYINRIIFSTF